MGDEAERRPKQRYWGLWTLFFLTLAMLSVLLMSRSGAAVVGLVVGLSGATFCSWRGLRDFSWLPR